VRRYAEYTVVIPGAVDDKPSLEITGAADLVYPCLKGDKVGRWAG
jgi:hypothetical protein